MERRLDVSPSCQRASGGTSWMLAEPELKQAIRICAKKLIEACGCACEAGSCCRRACLYQLLHVCCSMCCNGRSNGKASLEHSCCCLLLFNWPFRVQHWPFRVQH